MPSFASNASRLHRRVGETLEVTPGFKGCTLQQEVPVSELFPEYGNNKDKYDWVVPARKLVIECMGKQHYEVQTFGNSAPEAIMEFQSQQRRDKRKEEVALLNGWTYLTVPYTDEKLITPDYLQELYSKYYNEQEVIVKPKKKDPRHQEKLLKAKEYRKQQYQKQKVKKNEYSRSRSKPTGSSNEEDTT